MVVKNKKHRLPTSCMFLLFLISCSGSSKQDIQTILKSVRQEFVDEKYATKAPLVKLVNMSNYTNQSETFTMEKDGEVRIYAVGEILYNLSEENKRYYLKSDDIDLFFRNPETSTTKSGHKFQFNISKANEKEYLENLNIDFKWSLKDPEFIAEIKIPWKTINIIGPEFIKKLDFNITIGDNDDGYLQKAKIAWVGAFDPLKKTDKDFGQLTLLRQNQTSIHDSSILALKGSPVIDGQVDRIWKEQPSTDLKEVTYGFVKDSLDLSASVKSAWDNNNIYFLVRVTDLNFKWINPKDRDSRRIFVDEGWIENAKGERIWQMNPLLTTHAGGAYKNQKVDTLLKLPKGKYFVKYVSDESHSFGSWDADAPKTPFYGIVLYSN